MNILTFQEIKHKYDYQHNSAVYQRINKLLKEHTLIQLRKSIYTNDIYALDQEDLFKIANNILKPSYISFQTALSFHGVNFQYFQTIQVATYTTRKINIDKINLQINYQNLPRRILLHDIGIIKTTNYCIANKERAIVDIIYKYKNYGFDNLSDINWHLVESIARLYNQSTFQRILVLKKIYENKL